MKANQPKITLIDLARLDPHPHNPRGGPVTSQEVEELADSIREKGVLQPLLVVPNPAAASRYLIVAGHRRARAAEDVLLVGVPCIVREDLTPAQQEEVMLIENLQRQDLTPLQEAHAFDRLIQQGYTAADIIRNTGVNSAHVHSRLGILKLAPSVQSLFSDRHMPTTAVASLRAFSDPDRQLRLATMVASQKLTVRELKRQAELQMDTSTSKPAVKSAPAMSRAVVQASGDNLLDRPAITAYLRGLDVLFSGDQLLTALDGVCGPCGMGQHSAICRACPISQLFTNLKTYEANNPRRQPPHLVDERACA